MFAAGVLLFMMRTSRAPFEKACKDTDRYYRQFMKNKETYWNFHDKRSGISEPLFSQELKNLLESLFSYNPDERMSPSEVLKSDWLNTGDDQADL